ncbi:MAG: hypothetical protein HY076_09125 [Candidatus Eisenbacteria bacterium]|uniref:Porin n=1 Tax=Eiseniibacteriota bacterium TaxID=2212470 RepID=A0A9D6LA75_UNCEI|nr:hypothetical protein [Candidatus Eisenbacteria bacterium]MBI3540420.1 hypothetical protein [Candidatus Eisenbacteria bacterium]
MRRAVLILALIVWAAPLRAQSGTPPTSGGPTPGDSTAAPPPIPIATPTAPDFPRGRISGYAFGDYYYNVTGDPTHLYNGSGQDADKVNIDNSSASQIGRDLNGLQIRRIYFQLDNDLTIRVATRFRLEADSKSLTSDGKIGVAVRTAYVQVKSLFTRSDLYLGLLATPIWENSEEFWQYRSIEKTIADFRGLGGSMDLGAEVKGFADPDHHIGYAVMVGDGTGQKPEDNRYKKFYVTLPVRFGDLRIEPFVDYEGGYNGTEKATFKTFAGCEFKQGAVGVEAVDRVNHRPAGNQEPRGVSVFARVTNGATVAGFARLDVWNSDHRLADRVDSKLWIAGLDWQPVRDVHIMPNVEATQFIRRGTAAPPAHHDAQARITFYYRYSRPQS